MSLAEAFARVHPSAEVAFNAGEFDTAFASLAPDCEWHVLPSTFETGVLKGRDAVVQFFRDVLEGARWTVHAVDFIDAGTGQVLIHQRGRFEGRTTGIGDSVDFFQLWEIGEEGLVTRVREFDERDDALRAAGLG